MAERVSAIMQSEQVQPRPISFFESDCCLNGSSEGAHDTPAASHIFCGAECGDTQCPRANIRFEP
jgi:hypothetical protein